MTWVICRETQRTDLCHCLYPFSISWKSFTFCFSYPLWRLAPLYYPLFPYYCHIRSPSLNVPSLKFPFLRCNSQKNVLRTLYSCLFHRLEVMALSFSPRVAVWRAREPHKSDASVTHNRSLKKKKSVSPCVSNLIFHFTFLSWFATCLCFLIHDYGAGLNCSGALRAAVCVCAAINQAAE